MQKLITTLLGLVFLCLNYSGQSQITWTPQIDLSVSSEGNQHPRIVIDGSGNPMVIWTKGSTSSLYFTRYNGTTFTIPIVLNPSWLELANGSWMGPDIASKGDTVYVVMKRKPESADTNHVYIMSSFDGGINFNAPVRVDYIADSISRFPTVTIDDNGNPIVGFMKFDPGFFDARWVVARSNDMGNTFIPDVLASKWSDPTAEVCDCCPGQIIASGNYTAMLYRDNHIDIRDCWAGISNDNAVSFSSGLDLDKKYWYIQSCPATGPDGVLDGDILYSVSMNSASGSPRILWNTTTISDTVSNTSAILDESAPGLTQQNYPRIDKYGNALAIVWKQVAGGQSQLPIYFTNDINAGFPAVYDTVDLDNITNADVAIADGKLFVVWEDDNAGVVKFRYGTFTSVVSNINKIENNENIIYPNPSNGIITISANNISRIEVMNLNGLSIYRSEVGGQKHEVDLSQLPQGIYIVKITTDSHTLTKKILLK